MLSRCTSTSSPASTQITWLPTAPAGALPLAGVPASRTCTVEERAAGSKLSGMFGVPPAGGGCGGGGCGGGDGGCGGAGWSRRASHNPIRIPSRRTSTRMSHSTDASSPPRMDWNFSFHVREAAQRFTLLIQFFLSQGVCRRYPHPRQRTAARLYRNRAEMSAGEKVSNIDLHHAAAHHRRFRHAYTPAHRRRGLTGNRHAPARTIRHAADLESPSRGLG